MTQYWYEAMRWDDSVVMFTPAEAEEAIVQQKVKGVYICKRLKASFSMSDFSRIEMTSIPYHEDQDLLEAGEGEAPRDAVIMTPNGALCRYVKKLVKPRKGDPVWPILRRDRDQQGFVWAYRTQTLTQSTRNAREFPDDWEILEDWEEDILTKRLARR